MKKPLGCSGYSRKTPVKSSMEETQTLSLGMRVKRPLALE
jgi:hypothetical protein